MLLAYGMSPKAFETMVETKERGFYKATAVQVSTEAERERLGKSYRNWPQKIVAIHFLSSRCEVDRGGGFLQET